MVGKKSDLVWLRPQHEHLEESFSLFYPKKSSPPQISNFANAPAERQSNTKITTQVWERWGCKTASVLAKRTGGSKSLNLWEGEETWHTKLAEPCLKIDKAFATPATKAKPEMWEHRHYLGSGLFKHCPPQPHLSAAGSLPNTHCSKGQTLPICGTNWAFLGCSFWGPSSNNRTNIYTKAQCWAGRTTWEISPKALIMKARWTMEQVFRGVQAQCCKNKRCKLMSKIVLLFNQHFFSDALHYFKEYAQLVLDSLCPDKTLILNMAELRNNGLDQWFRSTAQPHHQRHSPSEMSLCRILAKQTGDKWHYRSLQMRIATKGWRNHQRCSRWWGGSVKGPHRCLRQPQRSALAQLPLCSKDFWCSALTTLLIHPNPSLPNKHCCLLYNSDLHPSHPCALQLLLPHLSWISQGFLKQTTRCHPLQLVNRVTMCHSHGGTEHRLHDCLCPHLLLLRATGSIFFFSFQTFVTEKYSMKSLIPLLLILFLSCRNNQGF